MAQVMAACNNARLDGDTGPSGDPTEVALLLAAAESGVRLDPGQRDQQRRGQFHFDPALKLMSTIDRSGRHGLEVDTKGAPEAVLARCTAIMTRPRPARPAAARDAPRGGQHGRRLRR